MSDDALGRTRAELLEAVQRREARMVEHTRRWVEVNSFTGNVEGVNRVGALLAEDFALKSLAHTVIEGGPGFGDHHAFKTSLARDLGARPIVLVGHHDTVFPPGTFEGFLEKGDGRAIGPGVFDMKGGLAVILGALEALEELDLLARLPLVVVSVADEEVGSPSSTAHLRELARDAQCALVFEPGREGDAIVTRRKGVGAMACTFHGKAAHSGNRYSEGVNAIWAAAQFVDAAQHLTDLEHGTTVNTGLIRGGTSKNTVPAQCEVTLDLRYETVHAASTLLAALDAAARASAEKVGGRVDIAGGSGRLPLERSEASLALKDEYAAWARAVGLGDAEAPLMGGGSDANTIAPLGVPVIDGLGPRGSGFHTLQETLELTSLVPKAQALASFLLGRIPRPEEP
jgi:glutamate carboxypeptidase